MSEQILRTSHYIAATADELRAAGPAAKVAAAIDQRVLFPHRGEAHLKPERLVFTGWDGDADVTVHRSEVTAVAREFTGLYGRFLGGGSKEWGAPIVLTLTEGAQVYALFDHRAFLEKTDNPDWERELRAWLG
ncbi:hypothetical protein CLV63_10784 [Murinocardiopsis flavida]|uniref:Uncharacterized protein n=1 Tax=Murinocardiopsis flavida TaxID=645275 RepID=A0A2P8DKK0_9ACTN|nr:hypothetical protein [Murinocardiopsis flavida]PSK97691.1 hypothetical protein CLV63_10784 [Murinocardiopsis flavida]